MLSRSKITYRRRIILALLLLSVLFYIPFTVILYTSTTAKIRDTVLTANQEHLNQIHRNVSQSKANLSRLTYSIYTGTNMQQLLYGTETGFSAISTLQNIEENFISSDASIHSIGFYNGVRKEYHSTAAATRDDSLSFVSGRESLEKLTPVFRKAQLPYSADEELYLLSYVMYELKMSPGEPSSFVIVNQDVSCLLDRLRSSDYAAGTQADVFLLSREYGICGSTKNITPEAREAFLDAYGEARETAGDSMTVSIDGRELLVSYAPLDQGNVDVVIVQPKSIVFSAVTDMHIRFFTLLALGMGVYLVVIYFLVKSLYRPVETLIRHIQETGDTGSFNKEANEFEQFKTVYSSISTMKQKYYLRYMEDRLLTNGSEAVAADFAVTFPEHWLPAQEQYRVVLITVESAGDDDGGLNLYAVQNIAGELLREGFLTEILQMDATHAAAILGSDGNWSSLEMKLHKIIKSIDDYFDFSVCVCCSDPVKSLEELSRGYRQTCAMEAYIPMFGLGTVLFPEAIQENLRNPAMSYSQALLNELTSAMTSRDAHRIRSVLRALRDQTRKLSIQNLWVCISLLLNHIRTVLQNLPALSGPRSAAFTRQLMQTTNEFTTVDSFFSTLETLITDALCASAAPAENADKNAAFLRDIEAYIAGNYQNPQLSPQQIADHFRVSANYLPRKFQQLSGTSLSGYILQVRMQQAAQLLLDNDLPNSEIAFRVGIENESYFYKLFKKHYGCTPKEFKARQQR